MLFKKIEKVESSSRFGHLDKFSVDFSSLSFVIRVNHPSSFMIYYFLFGAFLS